MVLLPTQRARLQFTHLPAEKQNIVGSRKPHFKQSGTIDLLDHRWIPQQTPWFLETEKQGEKQMAEGRE